MAKSSKRPLSPDAVSAVGSYDRGRVAVRAYELYMERGASDGADLEDWLRAEREFDSNVDSGSRGE